MTFKIPWSNPFHSGPESCPRLLEYGANPKSNGFLYPTAQILELLALSPTKIT